MIAQLTEKCSKMAKFPVSNVNKIMLETYAEADGYQSNSINRAMDANCEVLFLKPLAST